LGSFVAFLEGFRNIEYNQQNAILVLNILAIFFSFCKIIISSVTKKIKEGIQLVYISDIFTDYVQSFVIFIDISYLIMLFILLIEGNFKIILR